MSGVSGKIFREGISLIDLMQMFPAEESARTWFERIVWSDGPHCSHCGSERVSECRNHKPMPCRCKDCRKYFSAKYETIMHKFPTMLRQWAIAIYMVSTNFKGVSSMRPHRIHEAFPFGSDPFSGPVEVDETCIGGKRKNMSNRKRKEATGRELIGKSTVVGATDKATLQGFVKADTANGTTVYTDEAKACGGVVDFDHKSVKHSVGENVLDMAHTNGIESFWSMLKCVQKGIFHKFSHNHLGCHVAEFAGRHNVRSLGGGDIMAYIVAKMIGQRFVCQVLTNV